MRKRKEIDILQVKQCYELGQKIYGTNAVVSAEARKLAREIGMTEGSAIDYVINFSHLVEGTCYTRTMHTEGTIHYINENFERYGKDGLKKSLLAVKEHIKYYTRLHNGGPCKDLCDNAYNPFLNRLDASMTGNLPYIAVGSAKFDGRTWHVHKIKENRGIRWFSDEYAYSYDRDRVKSKKINLNTGEIKFVADSSKSGQLDENTLERLKRIFEQAVSQSLQSTHG